METNAQRKARQKACSHTRQHLKPKGPHVGRYCQDCGKLFGWVKQSPIKHDQLQALFMQLDTSDQWDFLDWADQHMEQNGTSNL